jgi:hypothetical protein
VSTPNWSPTYSFRYPNPTGTATATELLSDHRERLAMEEEKRVEQRTRQIEELRSEFNSASARIRAWEKMHGLSLPVSPTHPVLEIIAASTGVPLTALREEQQARLARQATAAVTAVELTAA